jgi:hypothetical protein
MSEDLSKLNLVELLELLEPLPEPPAVSLWPHTAGWIWLAIAVLAGAAWLARRWVRRHRANAYRRAALREIAAAGNDPAVLAEILRRTALSAFPRAEVAGLYGNAWLGFLDRAYGGTEFGNGPGRVLAVAPYAPAEARGPDLVPLAAAWVRRHRRAGARGP